MDNEKQPQKSEKTQEEAALLKLHAEWHQLLKECLECRRELEPRLGLMPAPIVDGLSPSCMAQANSGRASEEGSQLRRLGGVHHRQDLISRLQDEVRTWDQECTAADDSR
jgi:hypothetical protein